MRHHVEEAWEIVDASRSAAPVVLTCEHASNRMPPGWRWPEADRWITDTHWAWDIGIADITRRLAEVIGGVAVLSRFTRLLVDPNRELGSPTLFRDVAEGRLVHLNRDLSGDERPRRLRTLYRPYHEAVDRAVAAHAGSLVLAMHSFTPVYEGGTPRPMEIGVLFDREEVAAGRLSAALSAQGVRTALNEPYSGANGLMFSAQSVADRHGRVALELELRQDLAGDPARQGQLVETIAAALRGAGFLGS